MISARLQRIFRSPALQCAQIRRNLTVWEKVSDFFGPKVDPLEPLQLLKGEKNSFTEIAGYCDKDYGGGSESNWKTVNDGGTDGSYLTWEGTLHFDEGHAEKSKASGGFSAIRLSTPKPIDLQDYEGFELEIRSSRDLSIVMNMQCHNYVDKEIFQLPFEVKAHSDFVGLFAPFDLFSLSMNAQHGIESVKNDNRKLTALGFLLMTERCDPGDFKIDIRRITATDK
mmetsp:Transcript_85132/g.166546  ORF Transcript_85132/g.166546 Transcript_85132/m.166546 type:complete len:226 (-) Transcript_85132:31-708(-)|eukprot:CAMPEP_0170394164 /NCGR_PEP_ID=MMETSP0117_2-20130122/21114_1 /TAXON_ID=400756 /ORGANISM="Durinskia baltica, Strain CSIRO CS-38" /LENGTH=225 /DNA_ID=CAMNT_0010650419 /DNA_START=42 /DNA_END=719 /DNA_ORIENTATION=-